MNDRPKVAPYLTVSPASAAIAYYANVFKATQKALMPSMDGLRIMHCELSINGGAVMLSDAFPEYGQARSPLPGEPVTMSVSLEFATRDEVDETFNRATSFGAKGEMGPTNSFWGTRFAVVRDPFGHRWMLNAPLAS
ncbi:MAG: VOC family protein [Methylobacteriaceae bacterium]|nr:VOC family protein [Methylobacteriaceae bacterium]